MQISLNDLLIKSSPICLPLCPNKSQYCFSTLRGNLRKIMATFASEAYGTEQTTESKTKKPRPRLCWRNTQHFSLQIESLNLFIRDERQPKMNSQNFRDIFLFISGSNRLEEDSLLLQRLPGISVSMQRV